MKCNKLPGETSAPPRFSAAVYTLGCKLNQLESESIAGAFREADFSIIPWNETFRAGDFSEEPDILIINTCTVTSHSEQKARRVIRKALRDFPRSCILVTGCYAQVDAAALEKLEEEKEIPAGPGKRLFVIPGASKGAILDLPFFLAGTKPSGGPPGTSPLGVCRTSCVKPQKIADQAIFYPANSESSPIIGDFLRHQAQKIHKRNRLLELRDRLESWTASVRGDGLSVSGAAARDSFRFVPGDFSFHSRAFLKVQDGCDNRCAYCRVSIARGKSRSLGAAEALAALRELEAKGFGEAVLTGVNLSQYKSPSFGAADLPGLLEYLLEGTERIRIRLSSIEPGVFSPRFIRAVSHERIRPHFHLSLQSGSDAVLARMGRVYSAGEAMEGIEQLRRAKDDPFLACDIIAGFPGESAGEFEKTWEFCRRAGFAWIHAFPFSPRPGTPARDFKDPVSEREAGQRAGRLGTLAQRSRKEYADRWMGREIEFIAEADRGNRGKTPGFAAGLTDNYLRLFLPLEGRAPPPPGSLLRCRIRPGKEGENPDKRRFDAAADLIVY